MASSAKNLCPKSRGWRKFQPVGFIACLVFAIPVSTPSFAASSSDTKPDPKIDTDGFLSLKVDSASDLRSLAKKHLDNPDLWPVILQLNGLESIEELTNQTILRLPVGPLRIAAQALEQSLIAIQRANMAGAQLFAPRQIGQAIASREKAVKEKSGGLYSDSISSASKAADFAVRAKKTSEENRDVEAEARLNDRQGWVEGQKPAETSWNDRPLNSILKEQEKLRTLSDSTAQVIFRDASRLRLNANSQALIQRMRADPLTKREEAKISLVKGDFYALLGKEKKRSKLEVTLPNSNAKIDSGNFWVSQQQKAAKFSNYDIKPVEISAMGETLVLGQNEGAIVMNGEAPRRKVILTSGINLSKPDNNAVVFGKDIPLTWQPAKDANAYWVEIAHDQRFDKMAKSLWGVKQAEARSGQLTPGVYYWRVAVLDALGLPGQMSEISRFEVRQDTAPPFLRIDLPKENAVYRKAEISIEGEAEAGASVSINGSDPVLIETANFSFTRHATEGENNWSIEVYDPAGNITRRSVKFTLQADEKRPIIFDPALPRTSDGTFLTTGNVLSLSGKLAPDVEVAISDANGNLLSSTYAEADQSFTLNVPLSADKVSLMLKVTAASGFAYEENIAAEIVNSPPGVELTSDLPKITTVDTLALSLKTDQESIVSINDVTSQTSSKQSQFNVPLNEGKNTLEIRAVNAVGLESVVRRTIFRDSVKPEVTSTKLSIKQGSGRAFVSISVGAKDLGGLAKTSKVELAIGASSNMGVLRYSRSRKAYQGRIEAPGGGENLDNLTVRVVLADIAGNTREVNITQ